MLSFSACSEESIAGISKDGIADASKYNIVVTVDQETNEWKASLKDANGNDPKGVYAVWSIYTNGADKAPLTSVNLTTNGLIAVAGDYPVSVKIGNRNGVSSNELTGSIHIENTIVDYSPYINNLTGGSTKEWHINGNVKGHLGCGEPGTDGLGWWSAEPNDKAAWGVYDNKLIFTMTGEEGKGAYTYDPGESGTIYVNTGITNCAPYSDYNTNDGQDYCAPAEVQNTTFELYTEGADLRIKFPQGTLVGYLPNMEAYNEPDFKVTSLSRNEIQLVHDNGGIAWHYTLGLFEQGEEVFTGYKYDSEYNLWKTCTITPSFWFADNNWGTISEPDMAISNERIYFTCPDGMGTQQWQGQVHLVTDIPVSASESYDFSIFIDCKEESNVTVKVQKDGDDNTFFTADVQKFAAGGACYYFSGELGFDGVLQLCLDFGGNAGKTFEITNIVFKKHSDDDGTVLPSEPELPVDPSIEAPAGYKLVWHDEFEGDALNTDAWTHEVQGAGWVNNELQNYVNGAFNGTRVTTVSDGTLKITAFKQGNNVYSGRIYGNLSKGWKYGIIEAKIKLPKGKGTWPAFWMMPVNNDFGSNPWPKCGEIDIMEEVGCNANYTSSSLHTESYNHVMGTQKTAERLTAGAEDEFHVYRLEWTADYITTYVDGEQLLHFANDKAGNVSTWPFNKPFYVILNLAWGGSWGGMNGVDESALPATMEVDYVRVFQAE